MSEDFPISVPKIWASRIQDGLSYTFQLTLDDHIHIDRKTDELIPFRPIGWCVGGLSLFVSMIVYYDFWQSRELENFFGYTAATIAACVVLAWLLIKPVRIWSRSLLEAKLLKRGHIGKDLHVTIDERGIHSSLSGISNSCQWCALRSIEEDSKAIYFWLSNNSTFLVPARAFASEEERQSLLQKVREWSGRDIISPPILAGMSESERDRLDDPASLIL